jgi:hypothetical protein
MTAQEMQLQLMLGEARMENDRLNWKLAELQQDLDRVRPYPVRDLESFKEVLGDEENPPMLADGLDGALIGIVRDRWRCNGDPIAVYDRAKCIEILAKDMEISPEEAEEFFEYNTAGAYVGPTTPMFLERPDEDI